MTKLPSGHVLVLNEPTCSVSGEPTRAKCGKPISQCPCDGKTTTENQGQPLAPFGLPSEYLDLDKSDEVIQNVEQGFAPFGLPSEYLE